MARRSRALRLPAPPASLALAVSILILLGALAPAAADSAKRPLKTPPSEPGATSASGPEQAAEPSASTRQAAKGSRRHDHGAGSGQAPSQAPAEAPAGQGAKAPGEHHGAASKPAAGIRNASRRAERAAERAARKTGEATTGGAQTGAQGTAEVQLKGKGRKEREREQRRREREERHEREGHRESRREREAREAEEARAGEAATHAVPGVPVAGVTSVSASAAPAAPGASSAATPPTIAGESPVRSTASRSSRVRSTRSRAAAAPVTRALPVSSPSSLIASGGAAGAEPAQRAASRTSHKPPRNSPLVTTVTRIIGVIPSVLWIVIAALALAALAFATTSRVAARRARRLARQRQELLEDVGLLQAALLPELPARLGPVATTAAYRPASGPGAGGDFYDVFALEDGLLAVIVGDVSGHGREALPHTTLLRFTLRAYLEAGLSPREALRTAALALERQLGGSFATVVLATYDPRERLLTYACAGHPHPILTGLSHDAPIIACSAPPIGAGKPTGTRQTIVSIPGGAIACFYTDGVIEARVAGELYGTGRLAGALAELGDEPTAASLLDRVREGTDRRPDDMAACLLEIDGDAPQPVIRIEELALDGRDAGHARTRRFLLAAGVTESEIEAILSSARAIAADHGSALMKIRLGEGRPQVTLTYDNVAPLRARALARTQEVAL